MKKRIGITKKLFIITIAVFTVFISTTLIVQTVFFQKYYIRKKEKDLSVTMEKFKTSYNKAESIDKKIELMDEYEQEFEIQLLMFC